MNAKERYFWDLTGHLVVPGVLSKAQVQSANAALDYLADRCAHGTDAESDFLRESAQPRWSGDVMTRTRNTEPFLLRLSEPHCDPFRLMISHPHIMADLREMCGKGFRLDHGPQFIGGLAGTPNHTLHGSGNPHKPYVAYNHQNGSSYVGGVTVAYALADAGENDGGFACVPGSHKSKYDMPAGVRDFSEDLGVVDKPNVKAGDVLYFMDGAQTHGARSWQASHPRRSILIKYASRTSTRQGASIDCIDPEVYWEEPIVSGMTPEQRAVMFGPASAPRRDGCYLDVNETGTVFVPESS